MAEHEKMEYSQDQLQNVIVQIDSIMRTIREFQTLYRGDTPNLEVNLNRLGLARYVIENIASGRPIPIALDADELVGHPRAEMLDPNQQTIRVSLAEMKEALKEPIIDEAMQDWFNHHGVVGRDLETGEITELS